MLSTEHLENIDNHRGIDIFNLFLSFFILHIYLLKKKKLRAFHLLGKHSTTQIMPLALFFFSWFSDRVSRFLPGAGASDHSPVISAFHVAGMTRMSHYTYIFMKIDKLDVK
jgi:hypothetical protein